MTETLSLPADRLSDRLLALLLWLVGVLWMFPILISMMLISLVIPPWRTDWINRLYCRGQLLLTGNSWRADVHPSVDPNKAYLFAQNHINHFDHVVLYNATPHFKQGLELESHFKYPVYGWFMKSRGTIPVRPGSQGQTPAIMNRMREEIERGHSILTFPEGTRTLDGRVGTFRRGVFYIARDLGIPVVPVAVTGMYNVMRKGSWLIRPGHTITVHVCEPISTEGLTDEAIPAFAKRVETEVANHVNAYWAARQEPS
jgi:1-acyl-sn-glycerol-3-phosphate acyltransferase